MPKKLTDFEKQCRLLTERDFQRAYVRAAASVGFRIAHHYDSRFSDDGTRGFPDLTVVGHGSLYFIELKRELGKVSDAQLFWRLEIEAADGEWILYRPSDWDEMMHKLESSSGTRIVPEWRGFPVPRHKPKKRKVTPKESGE